MLVAIASLVIAAQQQSGPSVLTPAPRLADPSAEERRWIEFWQSAMRDAFSPLKANVLVDLRGGLTQTSPPRGAPVSFSADDFVRFMAATMARKPVKMREGWVLVREKDSANTTASRYRFVIDWLTQDSDQELRGLLSSGVPYAYLAPETKCVFARLCNNRGLQKKMASGEFASAELRLSFIGTTKNDKGQLRHLYLDLRSRFWPSEEARRDKLR